MNRAPWRSAGRLDEDVGVAVATGDGGMERLIALIDPEEADRYGENGLPALLMPRLVPVCFAELETRAKTVEPGSVIVRKSHSATG